MRSFQRKMHVRDWTHHHVHTDATVGATTESPDTSRSTPGNNATLRPGRKRIEALTIALSAAVLAITGAGCELSPSPDPEPPSGGQAFVLSYDRFATEIDSVLTANGCDIMACHGGGIRGTFELSPNTAKNIDLDYSQASLQVIASDPTQSPLLMKPLSPTAGGATHAADPAQYGFMTTDDPGYQVILAWINAGVYQ